MVGVIKEHEKNSDLHLQAESVSVRESDVWVKGRRRERKEKLIIRENFVIPEEEFQIDFFWGKNGKCLWYFGGCVKYSGYQKSQDNG